MIITPGRPLERARRAIEGHSRGRHRRALALGGLAGALCLTSFAFAGSAMAATGTLTLTGGTVTLTPPATLTWAGTLTGVNQSIVDIVPIDQQYTVNDATGTGAGWHVTASATTFTSGVLSLPNTGTLVNTGSVTSVSATTSPSAACAPLSTCTLPSNAGTTYPVGLTTATTAPTAVNIYDAALNTGLGRVVIGGSAAAAPVGWWVNVPGNAAPGTYISTITLAVVTAP